MPTSSHTAVHLHVFPQVEFLRKISSHTGCTYLCHQLRVPRGRMMITMTIITMMTTLYFSLSSVAGSPGARARANIATEDPRASANGARNLKPGKTTRWPSA